MSDSFKYGVQVAFDATSLSWYQKCPRYYQYKMIERWQPRRKSVHLVFGGHYARALELFYKYRALGQTLDGALLAVVKLTMKETWVHDDCGYCDGLGEVANTMGHPAGEDARVCPACGGNGITLGTGSPWVSDHNTKTRENLIRSIVWYVDQFGEDTNVEVVTLANGKPAVELSFTFDAGGVLFCGHLDRLVTYSGEKYVMDQKTTQTTITPKYFEGFAPDMQMSLYTYAGRIVFNTQVKGVIIDAAQIAVGFTRFERGFTWRTDEQLEEWFSETLELTNSIRYDTKANYFPMNLQSCGNYGGCEFRSVCSRSPGSRKNFLEADFTRGEQWDPIQRR